MTKSFSAGDNRSHNHGYDDFDVLADLSRKHFAALTANGHKHLFTTNASGLYEAYLGNLPTAQRKEHTCHTCRQFIERFGGLVFIDPETGATLSAFWPAEGIPDLYAASVAAMHDIVVKAGVNGVFISADKRWGTPKTGTWYHFGVTPPKTMVYREGKKVDTAFQTSAKKLEDYRILCDGLNDFTADTYNKAVELLEGDRLYRAEKVRGPARFLRDMHALRSTTHNDLVRENLTWLAIAGAPAGFGKVRSGMAGTLLEDVQAGLEFSAIQKRFKAKMDPKNYQRSQALPSDGNVAAAEQAIEKLGLADSLRRRFARLDEIKKIWEPKRGKARTKGGVFGHLKTKGEGPAAKPLEVPVQTMTWVKFANRVLPTAERIEFYADGHETSYGATVTAAVGDAKPILQWDYEDARNPFSWYLYPDGSLPSNWELKSPAWIEVEAVMPKPCMWNEARRPKNESEGVLLVLRGARDHNNGGLGLFPEILISDLHPYRSTIEAFSQNGEVEGGEEATANGVILHEGAKFTGHRLRVTTANAVAEYRIDRWD